MIVCGIENLQSGLIILMNKFSHRHQQVDHISKIRANLQEMKVEVSQYLKKHTKDTVPAIIKPKHFLLIDTINQIGSGKQCLKHNKITKDLDPQKTGHVFEVDRFKQRPQYDAEKKDKNKIVRQKRINSHRNQVNNPSQVDISCLLPNICNLKLEFDDQDIVDQLTMRHQIQERYSSFMNKMSMEQEQQEVDKRYHSIDLNQRSSFDQAIKSTNTNNGFRATIKHEYLKHNKSQSKKYSKKKPQLSRDLSLLYQANKNSDKDKQNKVCQQQTNDYNTLMSLSVGKSLQLPNLSDIVKTSKNFNQHSSSIQKRKIYLKISKQLQKRNKEKLPDLRNTSKHVEESSPVQKINKKEKQQQKKMSKYELIQPWQNQREQKDANSVLFQSSIF